MAVSYDCPACQSGNHEKHNHDWGVIPGVLGGMVCDCRGDCDGRFQRRVDAFREMFRLPPQEDPSE